jgi:serine phosphatase RsbU (regulator of sigma subunit)
VTERRRAELELARSSAELVRERESVELLQRSLMPDALPVVDGVELDGYYMPAGERTYVGGDWYDAFVLPDDLLGVVVGDVAGHGLAAAGLMGQLRNALRAYALDGASPSEVLDKLDALIQRTNDDAFATCTYATVDPSSGVVRAACAGHLPAIVVQHGAIEPWWVAPGTPLGAREAGHYATVEMQLEPGGMVLLYTDGLVERRHEPIDAGIERLVAAVGRSSPRVAAGLGMSLAAELVGADGVDDVCTLAVRRTGG